MGQARGDCGGGGGSVEFIIGDGRHATMLESRKLGAARMTAQFVKSDPINPADQKVLRQIAARSPEPAALGRALVDHHAEIRP